MDEKRAANQAETASGLTYKKLLQRFADLDIIGEREALLHRMAISLYRNEGSHSLSLERTLRYPGKRD